MRPRPQPSRANQEGRRSSEHVQQLLITPEKKFGERFDLDSGMALKLPLKTLQELLWCYDDGLGSPCVPIAKNASLSVSRSLSDYLHSPGLTVGSLDTHVSVLILQLDQTTLATKVVGDELLKSTVSQRATTRKNPSINFRVVLPDQLNTGPREFQTNAGPTTTTMNNDLGG